MRGIGFLIKEVNGPVIIRDDRRIVIHCQINQDDANGQRSTDTGLCVIKVVSDFVE